MDNQFELKIDFKRDSSDPARVFSSMAKMIQALQKFDSDLISTFNAKIEPALLLDDIQTSSLKSILKNTIINIDENALRQCDWRNILGEFLCECRRELISWMNEREKLTTKEDLGLLGNKIQSIAVNTDLLCIPAYKPIPLHILAEDIGLVTEAVKPLYDEDTISISSPNYSIPITKDFVYDKDSAEEILTYEMISTPSQAYLRVKKPDYLGESMWDFQYQGHKISAKIEDHNWLVDFQFQRVPLNPGDSLKVNLTVETHYDDEGHELKVDYRIIKVLDVVHAERKDELDLL